MATTLTCGITGQPIKEPVVTPSGHVYEKAAIERHLAKNGNKHPETGEELKREQLIPIKAPANANKPAKRMIADADTAVIDNSLMPEPLVMIVAFVSSLGAAGVLSLSIAFKLLEHVLLILTPTISLVWGLLGMFHTDFVVQTLNVDAALPIKPISALVAVASWGALQAGHSGCTATKAKFLFFVSLLVFTFSKDMHFCAMYSALPFSVGCANFLAPYLDEYLHRNQRRAVAYSHEVHASM